MVSDDIVGSFWEWKNLLIEKFEIPVFPLRGRDLISAGIAESSEIGTILKNLEKIWIDSNFSLTSEQLLQKIAK